MPFGLCVGSHQRNRELDEGATLGERVAHCKVWELSAVSCAEMAELIDLLFGLWTRVGQRKHKFNYISHGHQCAQFQSYLPGGDNVPT